MGLYFKPVGVLLGNYHFRYGVLLWEHRTEKRAVHPLRITFTVVTLKERSSSFYTSCSFSLLLRGETEYSGIPPPQNSRCHLAPHRQTDFLGQLSFSCDRVYRFPCLPPCIHPQTCLALNSTETSFVKQLAGFWMWWGMGVDGTGGCLKRRCPREKGR